MGEKAKKAEKKSIDLGKVNDEVMRAFLLKTTKQGHPFLVGADLVGKVAGVVAKLKEQSPGVEMIACKNCNGESPDVIEACPYCGGGGDKAESKKETTMSNAASNVIDMKAKKDEAAAKGEKKDLKDVPPKVVVPASELGKKTRVVEGKATIEKAPPRDVAPTEEGEKLLNAAIAEIESFKVKTSIAYYDLSAKLQQLHDGRLYTQRRDAKGGPKYKSFEAFCVAELGFTSQNAYKIMDLARFWTREQVTQFGRKKLDLLLRAPEEDRQDLLENVVKKGASKKVLEEKVNEARKKRGVTKRETGRKKMPQGVPPKKKAAKAQITVAQILGRQTVKLFAKPLKGKDAKPAKKLGDHPVGKMQLTNDVTMHFHLRESASGQLEIVVETKRDE